MQRSANAIIHLGSSRQLFELSQYNLGRSASPPKSACLQPRSHCGAATGRDNHEPTTNEITAMKKLLFALGATALCAATTLAAPMGTAFTKYP